MTGDKQHQTDMSSLAKAVRSIKGFKQTALNETCPMGGSRFLVKCRTVMLNTAQGGVKRAVNLLKC